MKNLFPKTLLNNEKRRHRRFTLLELIIAMALLGMVVTLLFFATSAVTSSWSRLLEEQNSFRETMTVGRTLDRLLGNAVPFNWRNEDDEEVPIFYGAPESVRFVYRHRLKKDPPGALNFVRLALIDHQLVAHYQHRPFLEADHAGRNLRRSVLADDIRSVRFYYADWHPEEGVFWREEWDPGMSDPPRKELPLAVGVNVTWEDGRREAWLRRTAGNSNFERFGSWKAAKSGTRGDPGTPP